MSTLPHNPALLRRERAALQLLEVSADQPFTDGAQAIIVCAQARICADRAAAERPCATADRPQEKQARCSLCAERAR